MLFPQELLGYLADPHAIDVDFFPGNLILACGIAVLWAMYLKLFEAMQVQDKRGLRMLWECALTSTVRVRAGNSKKKHVILDTMRINEALWTQHKGCTDTFFLLCEKLKRLKVMEEMKSDMKIEDELQPELHWDLGDHVWDWRFLCCDKRCRLRGRFLWRGKCRETMTHCCH